MAKAGHFPKRSFKYVYFMLLLITLSQLVTQLGATATLGFMALIDGEQNAAVGRGLLWLMFGSWAFFVFVTYLEMEAFEEKDAPFDTIEQPARPAVEYLEWTIRFLLVALVTVKLWTPDTYQEALFSLALITALLFVWSVVATLGFRARWLHSDVILAFLSVVCVALGWLSSDETREAEWGVLILLFLAAVTIGAFSVATWRLFGMGASRPAGPSTQAGLEAGITPPPLRAPSKPSTPRGAAIPPPPPNTGG